MKKGSINLIVVLYLSLFFFAAACSTGRVSFRRAEDLKRSERYMEAIPKYMEAVRKNPEEARYRLKLMEAMVEASNHFFRAAMENKDQKNFQRALLELNRALEYNPSNHLAQMEKRKVLKLIQTDGNGDKQTWIEKVKEKTALKRRLLISPDNDNISLKFTKKVELAHVFKTLAKSAGINIIFDSSFKNSKFSIILEDISFVQALDRICMLKGLFYKVLDQKTLIIIPDTAAKRKVYDEQIIKNYYLSNMAADDCVKLISRITRINSMTADQNLNSITVRDVPEKVALVERMIQFYDKRKAEVLVKVDIMEVNKDRLQEYGAEFSQYQLGQSLTRTGDSGGVKGNRFHYLDSSDFLFSIPTVIYKFLESDSDSRVLARPQVRGEDGAKLDVNLGDKVPVPRTSFVPYNTGGPDQQPITSYDLQDVGIEIAIVPHVHHNGEISLELDFKLTFITSPGTNTVPPTIGNRSVKTKIRLKDGETGIMAGLLRDSERTSQKGIPGLKSVPIIGRLLSGNRRQVDQTDIILRVTPYIVRMPDIQEADLLPIESGTENNIRLKFSGNGE
jgi:general secretion pathway protein D